jgi:hypothetical protein
MFFLDSLMISGIRWTLETVVTAAEAELNDDSVLREQLLDAEMRRELGEIDDAAFRALESELLGRIRAIRERREGVTGPLAFAGAAPIETGDGERFKVEASLAGEFHDATETMAPRVPEPVIIPPAPRVTPERARRMPRGQSRRRAVTRKRSA